MMSTHDRSIVYVFLSMVDTVTMYGHTLRRHMMGIVSFDTVRCAVLYGDTSIRKLRDTVIVRFQLSRKAADPPRPIST